MSNEAPSPRVMTCADCKGHYFKGSEEQHYGKDCIQPGEYPIKCSECGETYLEATTDKHYELCKMQVPPKMARVRIRLVIEHNGWWGAAGRSLATPDILEEEARCMAMMPQQLMDGQGKVYWIEAMVPIPEAPGADVLKGRVAE